MTLKEIKTTTKPQDSETLITVENVSKKFCRDLKKSLFYGVQDICTDLTGGRRKSDTLRPGEFWALDNISFDLKQGEALGLVGANGAGKSTLLRILSGLIKPDTGLVKVRGRLAPLIALGAGFNPILTGRENIYANMAILGLPTQQIEEKFEDVVEFAEIAEAIDAPVQTYSSGMAARLGFACAIHVEPEILLIDEVLAVGDVRFKLKCHQRLAQLKEKGTAFILVSHTPYIVLNACEHAIYLNRGKLAGAGETEKIIQQYEQDLRLSGAGTATGLTILPQKSEAESLGLDMLALFFRNQDQEIVEAPQTGEPAYLCIKCRAYEAIADIDLRFKINYLSGENKQVLDIMSVNDNTTLNAPQGIFEVQMYMPCCTLIEGVYTAKIYVKKGMLSFDLVPSFRFRVDCKVNISRCSFYQPRSWHILADERGQSWQEIEHHKERFMLQKGGS